MVKFIAVSGLLAFVAVAVAQVGKFPITQVGKPPTVVVGKTPNAQVGKLPTVAVGKVPNAQVGKLPTVAVGKVPNAQVGKIPTVVVGKFPTSQVRKIPEKKEATVATVAPNAENLLTAASGNGWGYGWRWNGLSWDLTAEKNQNEQIEERDVEFDEEGNSDGEHNKHDLEEGRLVGNRGRDEGRLGRCRSVNRRWRNRNGKERRGWGEQTIGNDGGREVSRGHLRDWSYDRRHEGEEDRNDASAGNGQNWGWSKLEEKVFREQRKRTDELRHLEEQRKQSEEQRRNLMEQIMRTEEHRNVWENLRKKLRDDSDKALRLWRQQYNVKFGSRGWGRS